MALRLLVGMLGFIMVLSLPSHAQPYLIQGSIEYSSEGRIYLASYYGDHFSVIDSIENESGSFHFLLPEEQHAGVYRLMYSSEYQGKGSKNSFVEFIYNKEDLTLNVSLEKEGPLPSFENSTENQVYFEFMTFQLAYEEKLSEVYGELLGATSEDELYLLGATSEDEQHQVAVHRYEDLQRRRMWFMDSLSVLYPDLYATRIMNAFRAPFVQGSLSHAERIESLKRHFFDVAAIEDPDLLHAPVYTYRIMDYLSLYKVDTLSMVEQEESFMEAVDQIMLQVAPQPELYTFVLDFLLEGFENLGMEEVQLHLADFYLDEACESDQAELVRSRMEGYRKMKIGATAPDFALRDADGISHTLSELPSPYTLVMFWSSTCGHCREMIPELKQWYLEEKSIGLEENSIGLEVVAISIDSSAALYEDYIAMEPMPWISGHDPHGWQGRLASKYQIYATPTLFLLDGQQTIMARPASFRQLQRSVKKLQ